MNGYSVPPLSKKRDYRRAPCDERHQQDDEHRPGVSEQSVGHDS
jgi:hypothetical protein